MKDKNDELFKNHTDNDDDFIEYDINPIQKLKIHKISNCEFKNDKKTGFATIGFKQDQLKLKIEIKNRPLVIGALKLALT